MDCFDPVADGYYLPEQQLATLDVVGQNVEQNVNWISQLQHKHFRGSAQRPTGHHRERNLSGSRQIYHNRAIDILKTAVQAYNLANNDDSAPQRSTTKEDHPTTYKSAFNTTPLTPTN